MTDFIYHFEHGRRSDVAVLALHGTGGDEHDLVPLARHVAPGASILSPRGRVLENGMPRFFRRLSEGVFDQDDLRLRANELADFISDFADIQNRKIIALGYSNGANIASALMLLRPHVLSGAILLRGMIPFIPETLPDLSGTKIALINGSLDPIVPKDQTNTLHQLFNRSGAMTDLILNTAGHGLGTTDMLQAQTWFSKNWG